MLSAVMLGGGCQDHRWVGHGGRGGRFMEVPITAWASWLVPLAAFELTARFAGDPTSRYSRRTSFEPSPVALSLPAMEVMHDDTFSISSSFLFFVSHV